MRVLLTGAMGQVGWELRRTLLPLAEVVALTREQADLSRPEELRRAVREARPRIILNAAAYTAVDRAEQEPEAARAVNALAPGVLAEEAARSGAALVHFSTDYVFDGAKGEPYREDDPPNPLNVYGRTKLEGEEAVRASRAPHLILRTSWVYGTRGRNFLLTMLRLAREREELRVVSDQRGAPTWSRAVAEAVAQILARGLPDPAARLAETSGTYHLSSGGETTWHGFAQELLERDPRRADQRVRRVLPLTTEQYAAPAPRPRYSVLDCAKLERVFGLRLPDWRVSLDLALGDLEAGSGGLPVPAAPTAG